VSKLVEAAKANRQGRRDATMIFVAYRHGLRTAELIALRWDAVDFDDATLAVSRRKNGRPATHQLTGRELRELRRLKREQNPASQFVFVSERGAPFTCRGFRRMIERLSEAADLGFPVHAHMLRHATGFKLANDGVDTRTIQAYLGHANIQNTVRYTELSSTRFRNLFRD
jgi:type 1 fimbriae regulatory protein FimB/type 1 fimbriae regulatory protein FimE